MWFWSLFSGFGIGWVGGLLGWDTGWSAWGGRGGRDHGSDRSRGGNGRDDPRQDPVDDTGTDPVVTDPPADDPADPVDTTPPAVDPVVPVEPELPAEEPVVVPVNEAPELLLDGEQTITLNPLGNSTFDVVDAFDADGDEFVFSLSGDDAQYFTIDPETGALTLCEGSVYYDSFADTVADLKDDTTLGDDPSAFGQAVADAAQNKDKDPSSVVNHAGASYDITVTVTDSDGLSDSVDLTVDVLGLL